MDRIGIRFSRLRLIVEELLAAQNMLQRCGGWVARAAISLCCVCALGSSHGVAPSASHVSGRIAAPRRAAPLGVPARRRLVSAGDGVGWNGALTGKRVLSLRGGGGGEGEVVSGPGAALMGEKSNIVAAVASKVGVNLHNQEDHPLQIIKSWFFAHFAEAHVGPRPAPPPSEFTCVGRLRGSQLVPRGGLPRDFLVQFGRPGMKWILGYFTLEGWWREVGERGGGREVERRGGHS